MSEIDTAAKRDAFSANAEDSTDVAVATPETNLDEDDRLRPGFISAVLEAVEKGDRAAAAGVGRAAPRSRRRRPARIGACGRVARISLKRLATCSAAEVLSELNDYVRDDVVEAISNEQIAELASNSTPDDAVAIIEDLDEDDQQEVLRGDGARGPRRHRERARLSRRTSRPPHAARSGCGGPSIGLSARRSISCATRRT